MNSSTNKIQIWLAWGSVVTIAIGIMYTASLMEKTSINLASAASTLSSTSLSNGLIAEWKLDEGSGTAVSDPISGSTGIFVGNPKWTSGKLGSALDFNGLDSRVQVTSQATLNNLNAMTISAWVYVRPGGRRIMTKGDTRPVRFYLAAPVDPTVNSNSIQFGAGYDGGIGTWSTATGTISYNAWHQVTVTYTHGNTANVPIIYIDGISQAAVQTQAPSGNPVLDNTSLYFGDRGDGVPWFDGLIDEVRIYNRILNPSEVGALYTADTTPPPNIVVIMTDDQDDTGSMAVMPKTLNLIGNGGLIFKNSFVDFSLCCPSRASFLTGQAAHNTGVLSNGGSDGGYAKFKPTQNNSLPVWLQQAGYTTAHMGKYLNGFSTAEGIPPGWSVWNGIADDAGGYQYYNYTINENGILHTYGSSPADYKTDVQAQKASDFIMSKKNSGQPFFLWLAPLAPHLAQPEGTVPGGGNAIPPVPAPRHAGLFNSMPLPQPPNFNETDISDKPGFMSLYPLLDASATAFTTDTFRKQRETLLAVDDMVEKVFTALQNAGKLDNTIIVFTSDNGFLIGQHRVPLTKYLVYEESIRVPLIIRGPGIPKGQFRNQLVNNLDLVATIEDLARVVPGRIPDGHSLVPLFQDASAPWRTSLLVQGMDKVDVGSLAQKQTTFGRYQAARTNNYMYAEHNGSYYGFEKEFYDLVADPYELTSRPNDPAYASVVADLQGKLNTLRNCAGTPCWMTSAEPTQPINVTGTPGGTVGGILEPMLPPFPAGSQSSSSPGRLPSGGLMEGSMKNSFQTPLKFGITNADVTKLQQFLANDSSIYPQGLVTGYFGPLTKQAVIHFQEKYASEILVPLGLTHGTGFVGPATLRKLNALAK